MKTRTQTHESKIAKNVLKVGTAFSFGAFAVGCSTAGAHVSAATAPKQSSSAEQSHSAVASQPASVSSLPEVSPTSIPSMAPSSPEASVSSAKPSAAASLTAEQLLSLAPTPIPYDPSQPYGSPEIVQALYKDIQLANMTGKTEFLAAALGSDNLQTDLAQTLTNVMNELQPNFDNNPAWRLGFVYEATGIQQVPNSRTYNLIATQITGPSTLKYAQNIQLGIETDPATNQQVWILQDVNETVPLPSPSS